MISPEALEIDQHVVVDLDVEELLDRLLHRGDAAAGVTARLAEGVGGVDAALEAAAGRAGFRPRGRGASPGCEPCGSAGRCS